ncbi:MAG: AbrB/MazE/SpoVT family DNA-binding domain-containing protein [Candidatus Undinarchaeales archaeon]|jgi:NAD-dependent SIR2 family protein deacetylase|nr:AbrB/MazE/SpoVT family DNA-binding domain-containing protein [Candidatus Undinarchaeales archaeon]MDP7493936.1 AbrB/MazE/SpoVT family DNA-binding domain-containing protein [Candidatus Undinarchaeales archaeon]
MRCGECGTDFKESTRELFGETITLWTCPGCGEELVDAQELAEVQKRLLGARPERRRIVQVGNSLAVTLPRRIVDLLGLKKGDVTSISYDVEKKAFVVTIGTSSS